MTLKTYLFRCKRSNSIWLFWIFINSLCVYLNGILSAKAISTIVNFDLQGGFELSSEKYSGNFIMLNGLASDHIWSSGMPSMAAGRSNFSAKKNTFALILDPQLSLPGGKYVFTPNIRPELHSPYG